MIKYPSLNTNNITEKVLPDDKIEKIVEEHKKYFELLEEMRKASTEPFTMTIDGKKFNFIEGEREFGKLMYEAIKRKKKENKKEDEE